MASSSHSDIGTQITKGWAQSYRGTGVFLHASCFILFRILVGGAGDCKSDSRDPNPFGCGKLSVQRNSSIL